MLDLPLVAQEEDKNEISIFVGATTNEDATAATFGVDYQRRLTKLIGLGVIIDHAGGDIGSTLLGPAIFVHFGNFEFVGAPVVEFSNGESTLTGRLGFAYEIELTRFSLSPTINLDGERSKEFAIVYGLSFGFGF